MTLSLETGYRPCACRDCMETAIGAPGAMCHECDDAGCPGDRECQASGAYGGEPSAPTPLPPHRLTGDLIRAACEQAGFFIITEGTEHPATMLVRLLEVFRALAPVACNAFVVNGGIQDRIPVAALESADHAFWASASAEAHILALMTAINQVAPSGFALAMEGEWSRLGFFR